MKARYNANLHASLKRNQTVQATNWERPMNIASFFLLITGLGLAIFAFLVKNRHKSKMARTIVNPVWKIKKKMKKSIAAGTKTIGFFSTNVKSTNSSDSDTTSPEQFVDDEQPVREAVKKKNTLRMSTDSDDSKPKGSSNYSSFWSLFVKDDDHDGIDEIPSKPTDDSEPIEQDRSQDDEPPTRKEKALPKSSNNNTPGWSEFFSFSGKREVETLIPVENRIETTNGVQVYAPPKKVDRQGQVVEMAPKVAKLAVRVTNGTMTYGPPSAHTSSNSNNTTFGPPSKRN
mmetsp:Transcript_2962/g.4252  ORF Transcript_2962/g.4252 Transcript_2962/m.4252 type:complete len:287 (-) Transcript_2962:1084-1944(-)